MKTGQPPIDLAKPLQGDLDFGLRHPTAIVAHDKLGTAVLRAPRGDADRAAELGEFDRVRDQVEQDLCQPRLVGL